MGGFISRLLKGGSRGKCDKIDEQPVLEGTYTRKSRDEPMTTPQQNSSENYADENAKSNKRNKHSESSAPCDIKSEKGDPLDEGGTKLSRTEQKNMINQQSENTKQLNSLDEKRVHSNDDSNAIKDSEKCEETKDNKEDKESNSPEKIQNQREKNELSNDKEEKKTSSSSEGSEKSKINNNNEEINHVSSDTVCCQEQTKRQQDCGKNNSGEISNNDNDIDDQNDLIKHENGSTTPTVDYNGQKEQTSPELCMDSLDKAAVTSTDDTKELNHPTKNCTEIKEENKQDSSGLAEATCKSKDSENKKKGSNKSTKKKESRKEKKKSKLRKNSNKIEILDLQSQLEDVNINNNKLNEIDDSTHITKVLEKIREAAESYEEQIKKYSGTNYSVDYFLLDENLMRLIEKLDRLKCYKNEELLKQKIGVVNYIKELQQKLDSNVKDS